MSMLLVHPSPQFSPQLFSPQQFPASPNFAAAAAAAAGPSAPRRTPSQRQHHQPLRVSKQPRAQKSLTVTPPRRPSRDAAGGSLSAVAPRDFGLAGVDALRGALSAAAAAPPGNDLPAFAFDPVAVPRGLDADAASLTASAQDALPIFGHLMPAGGAAHGFWNSNTSASADRSPRSHQRESSQSSLGSTGPPSPCSQNLANPHIAVTHARDVYGDLAMAADPPAYELVKNELHDILAPPMQRPFSLATSPTTVFPAAVAQAQAMHMLSQDAASARPNPRRTRPRPVASQNNDSSLFNDSAVAPDAAVVMNMPKFARTMTDACNDELFDPNFSLASSASPVTSQPSTSPASRKAFLNLVQQANSRLNASIPNSPLSPAKKSSVQGSSASMEQSFGIHQTGPSWPSTHNGSDIDIDDNSSFGQGDHDQTISPEVMPDFPDESNNLDDLLLFPSTSVSNPSIEALEAATSPLFPFVPTSQPLSAPLQPAPSMPLTQQQHQQLMMLGGQMMSQPPTSGNSLESLVQPSSAPGFVQKPVSTGASTGTYTCTYHGCPQRFETPALLQKHKREGHRQGHQATAQRRFGSDQLGGPADTQAGPHTCESINPSTGKPCNTVFSRPYDLTRHEFTIHNMQKRKVSCDICRSKTFSRPDALTRHYRVCHEGLPIPNQKRASKSASSRPLG